MELEKHLVTIKLLICTGLPMTLALALLALVTAFLLGTFLGVVRSYRIKVIHQILDVYLAIVRGIPFLLLLLLIFFCTPIRNKYMASLTALTIYNATYICEIIYGGIIGLGKGQIKAAYSLGMNVFQTIWYVILPQVLRLTAPALIGQFVILIKGTAACSAIGYAEVTRTGYVAMQAYGNPHVIFIYILILYFIICHFLAKLGKRFERQGKLRMMGKC